MFSLEAIARQGVKLNDRDIDRLCEHLMAIHWAEALYKSRILLWDGPVAQYYREKLLRWKSPDGTKAGLLAQRLIDSWSEVNTKLMQYHKDKYIPYYGPPKPQTPYYKPSEKNWDNLH